MLVPWANSEGAIAGAVSGAIMSGVVSFGQQYVAAANLVVPHKLPTTAEDWCYEKYGMEEFANRTVIAEEYPDESSVFPLFRLSFLWITPVGVVTVLTVGSLVSILTGRTNLKMMDPDLISPVAQWLLPPEAQRYAGSTSKRFARDREILENERMMTISTISN
nr:unnamed protein product [Callosobruchus chinensis]